MHILHVSSTFFTNNGLEIHVGYLTGLTMSVLTYSSTSFITTCLFSIPKTLCFYAIGGTETLTFRECLMICLGTPVTFEGFHANTSILFFSRSISCKQHSLKNCVPIVIFYSGKAGWTITFSSSDSPCSSGSAPPALPLLSFPLALFSSFLTTGIHTQVLSVNQSSDSL
ncbi:hypothetical protein Tco_1522498 [Tanacetum coccineum]